MAEDGRTHIEKVTVVAWFAIFGFGFFVFGGVAVGLFVASYYILVSSITTDIDFTDIETIASFL